MTNAVGETPLQTLHDWYDCASLPGLLDSSARDFSLLFVPGPQLQPALHVIKGCCPTPDMDSEVEAMELLGFEMQRMQPCQTSNPHLFHTADQLQPEEDELDKLGFQATFTSHLMKCAIAGKPSCLFPL